MNQQHAALCRITAAVEEARPDRAAMIAYVRQCIDGLPECNTSIGQHMRIDADESLTALLAGWTVGVKEAA